MRRLAPVLLVLAATLAAPPSARAQAVTYQADPAHAGFSHEPRATPPLARAWTRSFEGEISYPVIAEGKVFVTAEKARRAGSVLVALRASDGRVEWRRDLGPHAIAHAAYDSGRVYVARSTYPSGPGGLVAFSAATGAPLWESGFTLFSAGPPAAAGGVVYVAGDGFGTWVGAYRGGDGAELWRATTESGAGGSPAVAGDAVYASFACPDVFAFRRGDGGLLWHPANDCHGGGGSTPVHHAGRLYVREDSDYPPGDVYDSATGRVLGRMRADYPPAFRGGLGLFPDGRLPGETLVFGHTLVARSLADGRVRWRFRGDGYLDTAPLIVDRTVYVGSGGGVVYGLSLARGRVVWRAALGRPVLGSGEASGLIGGLAAGEGVLVVPAWRRLVAFARR